MTPRERLMLNRLVTRLVDAPGTTKDPDAELECAALLRTRPDAPYLLIQRCLLLEVALEQARAELERLRGDAAPDPSGTVGASAPGLPAREPSWAERSGFGARAGTRPMAGGAVPASPAGASSAGGGFLRQAAAVGAGVLGGSLLFQGLGSLLGGGDGHGLLGGEAAAALGADLPGAEGLEAIDPVPDAASGADFAQDDPGLADAGDAGFDDPGFDDGGGDDWA